MAFEFELYFSGLCGFAYLNQTIEAYLHFGHGDHSASLTIPTDRVDTLATNWAPTTIGVVQHVVSAGVFMPRQVAIWSLRGEDIVISDIQPSGRPSFDRTDILTLSKEHNNLTLLTKAQIRASESRVGVVTLTGSASTLAKETSSSSLANFQLRKNGVEHKPFKPYAQVVSWKPSGLPTITNRAKDVIVIKNEPVRAWAAITNAAPVKQAKGLAHFHHYYDGAKVENGDYPMTIHNQFTDVYDCVPPVSY